MASTSVTFTTSRRVEFRDTDAAGIMHFASILGMMEEAEHEFLRHVGIPLFLPVEGGKISWPRVAVAADFAAPARFEELLSICVAVQRLGRRSVTYHFTLELDNRLVATGTMTSACCLVEKDKIQAVDIPDDVVRTLREYVMTPEDS